MKGTFAESMKGNVILRIERWSPRGALVAVIKQICGNSFVGIVGPIILYSCLPELQFLKRWSGQAHKYRFEMRNTTRPRP